MAELTPRSRSTDLSRRELLWMGGATLAGWALGGGAFAAEPAFAVPRATKEALAQSPLVYVSPLGPGGAESRCHGEVWFFVDGGDVVIATASDRWKVEAIARGRDRARLWVGDFGPVKRAGDRYRKAPTFVARATLDTDRAVFDRLMAAFADRYADEWGKWKPRFAKGYDEGSRVLVRYSPIGA